jgi:hypothetical protein
MITLMRGRTYRLAIASQNECYNQPPQSRWFSAPYDAPAAKATHRRTSR